MQKSESTKNLDKAFLLAKKTYKPLIKNKTNPHFKSKYADLAAVLDAVEDSLATNGLVINQSIGLVDSVLRVYTELTHVDTGEFRADTIEIPHATPADAPKVGISCTYYRRYAITALTGIAADDDTDAVIEPTAPQTQRKQAPKVDQVPAKPTNAPRPSDKTSSVPRTAAGVSTAEKKPAELASIEAQSTAEADRVPTKEERVVINNKVRELREVGPAEKVNAYILKHGGAGDDPKKVNTIAKKKWDEVLERLDSAQKTGTLTQLLSGE